MSGGLLRVLSKGRTRVSERLNSRSRMKAIRAWVKAHENEIRRAKLCGYTWREITRACIEVWKETGKIRGVYMRKDEGLIRECWYDVQQESSNPIAPRERMMIRDSLTRTLMVSED